MNVERSFTEPQLAMRALRAEFGAVRFDVLAILFQRSRLEVAFAAVVERTGAGVIQANVHVQIAWKLRGFAK